MLEVVYCSKCPWYSDHYKLNVGAVWVVGNAYKAGSMVVSVLRSRRAFPVQSLVVAVLGVVTVGLGTLIIVL